MKVHVITLKKPLLIAAIVTLVAFVVMVRFGIYLSQNAWQIIPAQRM